MTPFACLLIAATLAVFALYALQIYRTRERREPRQPRQPRRLGKHTAAGLAIHGDPTYTPADVTA